MKWEEIKGFVSVAYLSIYRAIISKEDFPVYKYKAEIQVEAPVGIYRTLLFSSGDNLDLLKKQCEALLSIIQSGPWY